MLMMSKLYILAVISLLGLIAGCSSNLNCTRIEGLLGGDVNLVKLGEDVTDTLIKQSFPPLLPRQLDQPVLITTPVDNNDLTDTSSFGRSLQNHILSRFVQQGFVVKEAKLRRDVLIKAREGEFMLSRHLDELADKQRAQAVVVGTYSLAGRIMYLSVRLVSPGDRTILASYDKRLCLDENSLRMLGLQFSDEDEVEPPRESFLDKILY